MTFLELAEEVLKTAKEPLTLKQIWEIAISQELDKKVGSKGKTPMDTLSAQSNRSRNELISLLLSDAVKRVRISE